MELAEQAWRAFSVERVMAFVVWRSTRFDALCTVAE